MLVLFLYVWTASKVHCVKLDTLKPKLMLFYCTRNFTYFVIQAFVIFAFS